jgi:hypothetical protein
LKSRCSTIGPHLQSTLLCLFWKWNLTNYVPRLASPRILPIWASQIPKITVINHQLKVRNLGKIQGRKSIFFIFVSIYSLYVGGRSLCQFPIALHCTLARLSQPFPPPPCPATLSLPT